MNSESPLADSSATSPGQQPAGAKAAEPRRGFLKRAAAVVIGAVITIFPFASGLAVFFDPLVRKRKGDEQRGGGGDGVPAGFIKVASLEAVAEDGTPGLFRVIADKTDAWTYFPNVPVGSVFLFKQDDGQIGAFNVSCPHLGCAVYFRSQEKDYYCPCHNSRFALTGERSPDSPAPRGLDPLEVRVHEGQVYVKYQEFRKGTPERIVVS